MGCSASKTTLIDGDELEKRIRDKFGGSEQSSPKSQRSRKSSTSSNSSNGSKKSNKSTKSTESKKNEVTLVTREMIEEFQETSRLIQKLERKNTSNLLEGAMKKQGELEKDLKELEMQYADLQAKTKKEHQDVLSLKEIQESSSVSNYFGSTEHFDQQLSKEEEEYIEARTEEENCGKRLEGLKDQNSKMREEIGKLEKEQSEISQLYEKQDNILEQIFEGKYGSDLEFSLEEESDEVEKKQERVGLAMQKWTQAEATAEAATRQLDYACKRWIEVMKITNASFAMTRMQAMTETRNYLMAANRNLVAVQRLVQPVQVPYCNADETKTLEKAINYIFIDGMSRDRQHHALNVYRTTQQRSVMLLRWVTAVKTTKISEDEKELRNQQKLVNKQLRKERVRLMRIKVKEQTGEDLQFVEDDEEDDDETGDVIGSGLEVVEAEKIEESEGLQDRIKEATDQATTDDASATDDVISSDDADKRSIDELAPQPTKQELFGDLDSIMAEYKKQQDVLTREQDLARARQQDDFKEKLRRRRSRKMKKQAIQNATSTTVAV